MIALLLLASCGGPVELDKPNPPPQPPPMLGQADPELVTRTGVVTEVHGPTRSFLLTGEGERLVCVMLANGMLSIGGKPALVSDIPADTKLTVEGRASGDLVLVSRATTPEAEAAAPAGDATATPTPAPPAGDATATPTPAPPASPPTP